MVDTAAHTENETLSVSVNIPAHEQRGPASALFTRTRKVLIDAGGVCAVCGKAHTKEDPLEAHHHPVERCFAEGWDWELFALDAKRGLWGDGPKTFDWDAFFANAKKEEVNVVINGQTRTVEILRPVNIYSFVDNMLANGLLLCKEHHTGKGTGIHTVPFPIFLFQKYAIEGYQFNSKEVIDHRPVLAPPK